MQVKQTEDRNELGLKKKGRDSTSKKTKHGRMAEDKMEVDGGTRGKMIEANEQQSQHLSRTQDCHRITSTLRKLYCTVNVFTFLIC